MYSSSQVAVFFFNATELIWHTCSVYASIQHSSQFTTLKCFWCKLCRIIRSYWIAYLCFAISFGCPFVSLNLYCRQVLCIISSTSQTTLIFSYLWFMSSAKILMFLYICRGMVILYENLSQLHISKYVY